MQRRKFVSLVTAASAILTLAKPVSSSGKSKSEVSRHKTKIKGVNHIGISVSDMTQSIHFYRDLIGLELLGGKAGRFEGEIYDQIFQLKSSRGKIAALQAGSIMVELFEFEHPLGQKSDPRFEVNHHRINHISFAVTDIESEYKRLKDAGVYFHCPPQSAGPATATYGRDPDGNVFELLEYTY